MALEPQQRTMERNAEIIAQLTKELSTPVKPLAPMEQRRKLTMLRRCIQALYDQTSQITPASL